MIQICAKIDYKQMKNRKINIINYCILYAILNKALILASLLK